MDRLADERTAEHQIDLRLAAGLLSLSCPCCPAAPRREGAWGGRIRREPIDARMPFPAADALAAWRAWHEENGVLV